MATSTITISDDPTYGGTTLGPSVASYSGLWVAQWFKNNYSMAQTQTRLDANDGLGGVTYLYTTVDGNAHTVTLEAYGTGGSAYVDLILKCLALKDGSGNVFWSAGNDGAGSGLDADTVDGEQASAIVTETRIKAALASTADLQDTDTLQLKQNCNITADGGGAGTLYSTSVRDSTTAAAANMVIDATGGFMQRSTSSRRYKKNIRRAKWGVREVMKLRPVTYRGRGRRDGDKVHGGLIAEEVFEAGLPEFVTMRDGQPDGLAYGHMVALLVGAIQEQQRQIEALTKKASTSKKQKEKRTRE